MRIPLLATLPLLASCLQYEPTGQMRIDSITRFSGSASRFAELPLSLCDDAGHFGEKIQVLGAFIPEVHDAMSDSPQLIYPTLELVGPQTVTLADSNERQTATQRVVKGPASVPPALDGLYSMRVVDFDGSFAELPGAVLLVAPPQITSVSPQTTCASAYTTVTLRGGVFSTPVGAAITSPYRDTQRLSATFVAPDEIQVGIPYGTGASASSYTLTVYDGLGCAMNVTIPQVCP